MRWITSRSFLSIKLCSRVFLAHVCSSFWKSGPHILSADERFASCGLASIFVLFKHWIVILSPLPLWRLVVMLLAVVLGFFSTVLTLFLSSAAAVVIDRPVRCVLLSAPVGSFFFSTLQMVLFFISSVSEWRSL